MKNLILALLIITASGLLSTAALANNKEKKGVNSSEVKNTMTNFLHQYTLKLQSIPEAEQNKQIISFVEKLNKFDKININRHQLKSATNKAHKLDSLLVERWNDNSGQLEPSQLERWTWNEKSESESWELYDIDTLTNKWTPNDKEVYAWDENGNKTMHMDYDPDSLSGTWKKNAVENYRYNSNGDELEQLVQLWDYDLDDWVNYAKTTQEYDALRQTAITQYDWNTSEETWDIEAYIKMESNIAGDIISQEFYLPLSSDYIMHEQHEYAYDSLGNQTQVISNTWDDTSKQFIPSLKNTNEFDVNGNETAWRQFTWNATNNEWDEQWIINYQYDSLGFRNYRDRYNRIDSTGILAPSWKNEYTNNDLGKLLKKIAYDWISGDSLWTENYQRNYEYTVSGEISYEDYSEWNSTAMYWSNIYKKNNSFNTIGKLIHEDQYNWDTASNEWIGEHKETYTYDANNNYLGEEKQVWDTLTNNWGDLYNYDFTYDLSLPFSEIAFPFDFLYGHLSNIAKQDQYANKMVSRNYSEQKNGQLELTEKTSLFYSEINITGISEQIKNTLCAYPNPATEYIAFKGLNTSSEIGINLYNLQGKKMLSKKLNATSRVNINHLKSGIYIYELTNETEVFRGKISKK